MLAIGVVYAPSFARLARASVLSLKEHGVRPGGAGARTGRDGYPGQHVLPNVLAPMIVQTSFSLSTAILTEASLSFLGLGTPPSVPSWGSMLSASRRYVELDPGRPFFRAWRSCCWCSASTCLETDCATSWIRACEPAIDAPGRRPAAQGARPPRAGSVREGAFPGAVALIALDGEVVAHWAVGDAEREPGRRPMQPDTIFDLASLTKPVARCNRGAPAAGGRRVESRRHRRAIHSAVCR